MLREVGAGLAVGPNAVGELHRLGLADALRAVGVVSQSWDNRDGHDGAVLARLPLADGALARWGARRPGRRRGPERPDARKPGRARSQFDCLVVRRGELYGRQLARLAGTSPGRANGWYGIEALRVRRGRSLAAAYRVVIVDAATTVPDAA
jgi:hypothetical protein